MVIEDASAQELLPDLPYWKQGQDGSAQGGQRQVAPSEPPGQQQQQQMAQLPPHAQQPAGHAMGMPGAATPQQGPPPTLPNVFGGGAGQVPTQGAVPSGLHPLQRRELEQQQQQQQLAGMPPPMQLEAAQLQHPQQPASLGHGPSPMQAQQQWRPPQQPRPPGAYPSLPTRR